MSASGDCRMVLLGPGERTWLAEAQDVTPLPGLALALVRSDGLGVPPLMVLREGITAYLVRDHFARCTGDAPHAAAFVDRRLEHGLATGPVLRPLVLALLRTGLAPVRAALAVVLALPGGEGPQALRGELADVLLREETDPEVLDAFLEAVASGAAGRSEGRTASCCAAPAGSCCGSRRSGGLRAADGGAGPGRPGLRRAGRPLAGEGRAGRRRRCSDRAPGGRWRPGQGRPGCDLSRSAAAGCPVDLGRTWARPGRDLTWSGPQPDADAGHRAPAWQS